MRTTAAAPVTIRRLSPPHDLRAEFAADTEAGMASTPKRMPSKYIYDATGSQLFEEITRLPEYYLTRTEASILRAHAEDILAQVDPDELIELGSGDSDKTRHLLDAMLAHTAGHRYVPIDISREALTAAVQALCSDYPTLAIDGLIGDYDTDLPLVPQRGRRLVTFLGSTIGNLIGPARVEFLTELAGMLSGDDRLLLGVDMVKDPDVIVAAYDDSAGVTARFTRNVLEVVNRELAADFEPSAFAHRAIWNPSTECMEAWLEATRPMEVHITALGLAVQLECGEGIHVEVSCKFARRKLERELAEAGLRLDTLYTDPQEWYGLALAAPAPGRSLSTGL